ncbi:MAG: hypothetical protein ACPG5U_06370 [Planktomarina sp.]
MFAYGRSPLPRLVIMGGALAVAAAIGFVMQNSDSSHLSAMYAQPETAVDLAPIETVGQPEQTQAQLILPVTQVAPNTTGGLGISDIQLTSSLGDDVPSGGNAIAASSACDVSLLAAPGAAAIIDVILSAPCSSNDRVTVHHEGMMFSILTDAQGRAQFQVPALKLNSSILVALSNGYGKSVDVTSPSIDYYDRVVLQWQGDTGLEFHAFEYGATYNQTGHVWAGSPQSVSVAAAGDGGFLMQLGDPAAPNPLLAEVYTFPTGITQRTGQIEMSVEAEINRNNCHRDVDAQTLQFTAGKGLVIHDLILNIPDCQAIGEFLVLNNLVETMKLALN